MVLAVNFRKLNKLEIQEKHRHQEFQLQDIIAMRLPKQPLFPAEKGSDSSEFSNRIPPSLSNHVSGLNTSRAELHASQVPKDSVFRASFSDSSFFFDFEGIRNLGFQFPKVDQSSNLSIKTWKRFLGTRDWELHSSFWWLKVPVLCAQGVAHGMATSNLYVNNFDRPTSWTLFTAKSLISQRSASSRVRLVLENEITKTCTTGDLHFRQIEARSHP
jgi:hypothetical protein